VTNIAFLNCQVGFSSNDNRPALKCDNDGKNIKIDGLTFQKGSGRPYDLGFINVNGYQVTNSDTPTISASGSSTASIVFPPVFNPYSGTYSSGQTVAITSATSGAAIHYTTDDSTPTASSGILYSGPITLTADANIRAIASASGSNDSAVNTAIYTIAGSQPPPPQQVADPVFNPAGGTYSSAQTVSISTATSGATIHYTTDGSTPSETAGTTYSSPISVSANGTTLKAIAFKSGLTDSNVTSATYTITTGGTGSSVTFEAENLTYTPNGATASVQTDTNSSGGKWVELAGNSTGDTIDFAIPSVSAGTYSLQMEWKGNNSRGILQLSVDGTNVGPTLDQYASGQTYPTTTFGTVTFGSTGTHTVRLTVTGKNSSSSNYQLSADKFVFTSQGGSQQQAATPTFSPAPGSYSSAPTVSISSATSGASIRYTTDGSTPTETTGTLYSGAITLSATTTLKAIAFESGFTDSALASGTYTIGSVNGTTVSFEAESLAYTPSGATASVQTDTNSSGGKWIELAGNSVGDSISFTTGSVNAGTYSLQMEWKGNNSRGTLQLSVDGTNLGPTLDQYSSGQTYPTTTFGTVSFGSTGTHTVVLTVTGKNSASSSYQLSADKFTFNAQ
jgi:kynurenine formamidase